MLLCNFTNQQSAKCWAILLSSACEIAIHNIIVNGCGVFFLFVCFLHKRHAFINSNLIIYFIITGNNGQNVNHLNIGNISVLVHEGEPLAITQAMCKLCIRVMLLKKSQTQWAEPEACPGVCNLSFCVLNKVLHMKKYNTDCPFGFRVHRFHSKTQSHFF